MNAPERILVTPRSLSTNGHPLLQLLTEAGYRVEMPFPGRQPSEEDLLAVLPGCSGYLAGVERISGSLLERCPDLRVISRYGVGYDNIDMATVRKLNIAVKITRGANSRGVAELAIALLFSLARNIAAGSNLLKQGGWERSMGFELAGKTLGIVGTGQIGRQVAAMATALGMQILAYDPYPAESAAELTYTDLETLFGESDIVTLHCPADEKPLLNGELLRRMKTGSFIINTARSTLVDQDALLEAMEQNRVAGYAVDAFDSEPPQLTPLLRHPHTLMTAHIGGYTLESAYRVTKGAVDNLLQVLQHGAESDI